MWEVEGFLVKLERNIFAEKVGENYWSKNNRICSFSAMANFNSFSNRRRRKLGSLKTAVG
jgi:hypothetical protein